MRKLFSVWVCITLILSLIPVITPADVGGDAGGSVGIESFGPFVYQCGGRSILDDEVQPWRISDEDAILNERNQQYLFEGERYEVDVLVFDKNKIEDAIVDLVIEGSCNRIETKKVDDSVTYCVKVDPILTEWNRIIKLPKFDTSLGDLKGAEINLSTTMSSNIRFEHTSTDQGADVTINVDGDIEAVLSDGTSIFSDIMITKGDSVTTYDGTTDFDGSSGRNFDNVTDNDFKYYFLLDLNEYTAQSVGEEFNVSITAVSSSSSTGSANLVTAIITYASAEACVTYNYEKEVKSCGDVTITNNCYETELNSLDFDKCNVRVDEEQVEKNPDTMKAYRCFIDILDSEHMYGWFLMKVTAENINTGGESEYDEKSAWFVNPIVSLEVDGDLIFETKKGDAVRPGTSAYANTYIKNTAEGGVLLDMFITGNDWSSVDMNPSSRCWDGFEFVNYLPLSSFRYYTENGFYSTRDDKEIDDDDYSSAIKRNKDIEGYVNIHKQLNGGFEEAMFDEAEILQAGGPVAGGKGYSANVLSPKGTMSMTFRLDLPEPCYGEFEAPIDGGFFIWAEAI